MAKTRILVVEDELVIARDIRNILTRLGYDVPKPVDSGEAALASIDEVQPNLVLMDIHLAGEMDGITAAEQIRQRLSIPIVYLTAHSDDATLQRANLTGPYGYVLKPFEERELAIAIDIALYRHGVEQKLHQMERWLGSTLRSIGDAVLTTDLQGRITFMNQIGEILTGWERTEAVGHRFDEVLKLVNASTRTPLADLVQRVIQEEMVIEIGANILLITRDGSERPVDDSAAPIRDNQGNIIGVVIVFRDVTVRRQVEDQLRYAATHDPLTGLPNRAFIIERLIQVIEHTRRYPNHKYAVLLLDLDRFKVINDSLGHLAGDQVLIAVAQRLEKVLRTPDSLGRLGGDEFIILLDEISQDRDVLIVADRIQEYLKSPIIVGMHEIFTGASIGIVLNETNYQRPDEILRDADNALYRAKATGRGNNVIFDTALHERAMASLRLENDLRRAVTRREFIFEYQPIVSLDKGQIYGFEALLRWQHPERGLLLPDAFLGLAEEAGSLDDVREWLLFEVCQQLLSWQKLSSAQEPISLSVNISKRQFNQPNLVEQLEFVLSETGIAPHSLCLEMKEEVFANLDGASSTLMRLHDLGIQLHMDNFGTGCSSLSNLHHVPIDTIKIDRSFVKRLNGNGQGENAIVRAMLMVAHELKMNVIAEGVETNQQATYLKSLDCPFAQGNFFSKPLPAKEVGELLNANGSR